MVGINAGWVVAFMADKNSIRNCAVDLLPYIAVGHVCLWSSLNLAVARPISSSHPNPARLCFVNLIPKLIHWGCV